jgi:hypothetical protein
MQAKTVAVGVLAGLSLLLSVAPGLLGQGEQSPVRIRIVDDTAGGITTGRATIEALNRSAPILNGVATFPGLPDGVWVAQIRAIGFAPESVSFRTPLTSELRPVNVHRIAQPLAPVSVVSHRDSTVLHDIEARLRVASGTLITADNPSVKSSTYATDALRVARGFSWKSPTRVLTRGTAMSGGGSARCESIPSMDSIQPRTGRTLKKVVVVYLDGTRMPGGLESINRMVPVSDILAIEAYPDVLSAPFLWRTNDACAVIAYWTKRP